MITITNSEGTNKHKMPAGQKPHQHHYCWSANCTCLSDCEVSLQNTDQNHHENMPIQIY